MLLVLMCPSSGWLCFLHSTWLCFGEFPRRFPFGCQENILPRCRHVHISGAQLRCATRCAACALLTRVSRFKTGACVRKTLRTGGVVWGRTGGEEAGNSVMRLAHGQTLSQGVGREYAGSSQQHIEAQQHRQRQTSHSWLAYRLNLMTCILTRMAACQYPSNTPRPVAHRFKALQPVQSHQHTPI